ncbi:MAG: hypothetical protein ACLTYW_00085 [Collinsella sp.]
MNGYKQEAAAAKTTEAATKAQAAGLADAIEGGRRGQAGPRRRRTGARYRWHHGLRPEHGGCQEARRQPEGIDHRAGGRRRWGQERGQEEAGAFDVLTGSTGSARPTSTRCSRARRSSPARSRRPTPRPPRNRRSSPPHTTPSGSTRTRAT